MAKEKSDVEQKSLHSDNHLNHRDEKLKELIQELKEENEFIKKIADTLPPEIYFGGHVEKKLTLEKHSVADNMEQALKRKKPGFKMSIKQKQKRIRFGLFPQKTVSEMLEKKRSKKSSRVPQSKKVSTKAENVEDLKKRLQEHINKLKTKRNEKGLDPSDALEKRNLKRQMKKLRNKKVKSSVPSVKTKNNTTVIKAPKKNTVKPVYNKESNLMYSKFDFAEPGMDDSMTRPKSVGKEYKKLLANAEKKVEKLEELKNTDSEKAEQLITKEKWKKAIQKSEGMKLKDDLGLLKKSLKRQEKRKQKSSKKWEERIEQVDKNQKLRQEKRTKNIQAQKEDKLKHKIKRAKKRGRVIPSV